MSGMTDARALAELVVADTALVGTLARLPEHVQGVIRAYGGLCARKAINTYAARLRGEAAQDAQAVVWQRRKVGGTWETCTAIEHTNYPQPGYEYRTNRPQPTAVAGDVERALAAKWRNKADSLQFSGTWAGDYVARFVRDCADELEAALSSTAAPVAVSLDGCTESNCPRCLAHPDHRGDMVHTGIGSYPPAPAAPAAGVRGNEAALFLAAEALRSEWNLHYPDAVRMARTALNAALRTGGGA